LLAPSAAAADAAMISITAGASGKGHVSNMETALPMKAIISSACRIRIRRLRRRAGGSTAMLYRTLDSLGSKPSPERTLARFRWR
jgi:hypothetical protein